MYYFFLCLLTITINAHLLDIVTPIDPTEIMTVYYVDGSTQIFTDGINLTPDLSDKSGRITSLNKIKSDNFEVHFNFSIFSSKPIMGNGVGIWFTDTQIYKGELNGGPDVWKGISILINTNENNKQNNPLIVGIVNDGTKRYTIENNGIDIANGYCSFKEIINKKDLTTLLIFKYNKQNLTVQVSLQNELNHKECFTLNGILLEPPFVSFSGKTSSTSALIRINQVNIIEENIYTKQTQLNQLKKKKKKISKIIDENDLLPKQYPTNNLFGEAIDEDSKVDVASNQLYDLLITLQQRVNKIEQISNENLIKYKKIKSLLSTFIQPITNKTETYDITKVLSQIQNLKEYNDIVMKKGNNAVEITQRLVFNLNDPVPIEQQHHPIFWFIVVITHLLICGCMAFLYFHHRSKVSYKTL
ncbi:Legume family lectin family protein, membrane-bound, putative [Entamoeba histolytica HM-1:IMSS-B]|uniref:Vesicular integral membrane protein VIP36, putative n=5 Tax=Entamoeba histolytica TaxID=5759 RepID=C4LZ13_ENTH1|nr:vesicular integral membrane protein VIP36, putative [Entamoeba histolytica HM-1:IMSS]EMH73688.1 Legume family lectin family protein, membrane-bound, putative [Entamoeba histolytica HM-1:IMSS-B]EMS12298.1 vesicular integral membrane protein VIP36, putative [Entamoeba histolytica HM-3:IMSS]ENY61657.1 vesicular integral membrane protein VIP36, putative [Entamoeba histolytica HM-1:IMSS-A]GAT94082.1 legume-like lectin family protein membrane-bound [Entamoeba histolytica]EAL44827.1 vesicular inte|eukprot:XP_650213.1 vesicular integral membrane protein VIP36, putative [Entamoeba histolytica HM-1:IMSS]